MTTDNPLPLITAPPYHLRLDRWWLVLTPAFRVGHETRPNAWCRFWQRALLGWRWEPVEGSK